MGRFITNLLSSDESVTDSLIVGGLLALLALIAFTGYALVQNPASFGPLDFATATAAILAAIGGGRRLRGDNTQSPETK